MEQKAAMAKTERDRKKKAIFFWSTGILFHWSLKASTRKTVVWSFSQGFQPISGFFWKDWEIGWEETEQRFRNIDLCPAINRGAGMCVQSTV